MRNELKTMKKFVITVIALTVAALHFLKGRIFQGQFHVFVNGDMIDILLPMTLFLLMGFFQNRTIRSSFFRAGAVLDFVVSWRQPHISVVPFSEARLIH
jgi:hypothetical protein